MKTKGFNIKMKLWNQCWTSNWPFKGFCYLFIIFNQKKV